MAPQPTTDLEILRTKIDYLSRLVQNTLIDNPNFKPVDLGNGRLADGVYFTHFPTVRAFVEGPLRSQASGILKQISEVQALIGEPSQAAVEAEAAA